MSLIPSSKGLAQAGSCWEQVRTVVLGTTLPVPRSRAQMVPFDVPGEKVGDTSWATHVQSLRVLPGPGLPAEDRR